MADEPQGVVVSLSQIYTELRSVHREVTEMRAEVKSVADHENRIRQLEKKIWVACGASSAIAASIVQGINTVMGA